MSNKAPHPPDETADDLRSALRRNHPELSEAEIDAILCGPPSQRRTGYAARWHWVDNRGKDPGNVPIVNGRRSRGGWRGRRKP